MLRETVMEWTREWEQNGVQKGEARLLMRQLELKFGALRPEDQARIDGTDAERLLSWGERVLTARSLDEVFSG